MEEFQIPSDGSVLIIDDRIDDIIPLIQLLSKKGIATTYYSGKDSDLPEVPTQKIRLVFADIQLFGPSDSNSYAQNIRRILDSLVSENNGPYLLVIWSTVEAIHADTVEETVMSELFNKRPLTVLRLEKSSFFETVTDHSLKEEVFNDIDDVLATRFSNEDLEAIKNVLQPHLTIGNSKKPITNALELIGNALKIKLAGINSFHLFTLWENLVHESSGEIVKTFSTLYPLNQYWEENLKHSVYRMSHAQLGKTVDLVDEHSLVENALKTINTTFLDVVEKKTSSLSKLSNSVKIDRNNISFSKKIGAEEYQIKWKAKTGLYKLYIDGVRMPIGSRTESKNISSLLNWGGSSQKNNIKLVLDEYLSITPEINTRLLIDLAPPKTIQPGHVFLKENIHWKRKRNLLKTYFDESKSELFKKDTTGKYIISNNDISRILFIELEVTPQCDYVQNKWRKSRLLPGVLIPQNLHKDKEMNNSDSFYRQIPLVKINGETYEIIFDFRFFKSIDIKSGISIPFFRVRNELFSDILSRLSSHASRMGITVIE
jgi:hypothetical protein